MGTKKYEVIAPVDGGGRNTYWNGVQLLPPGTIVELDDSVKVSPTSRSLKPYDGPRDAEKTKKADK